MTGYLKRLLRAGAVALAAGGLSLVSLVSLVSLEAPAHAGNPRAWLTKTQWLTSAPNSGMAQSCTSTHITLAADVYEFGVFAGGAVPNAGIYSMAAGTWSWWACITPEDGQYYVNSVVRLGSTTFEVGGMWTCPVSGTYSWGAYLDPNVV